ncbi:PA14 domain-containing protein [Phaeobacter inhibens]|uniref:PA14 domain-containing protein n=1 Tax=Phaeobacter inhibens TaxID=221822 RepID=UPI001C30CBB6|nr:PA14 domain-containing protein [Phaeobacter inhibens]
MFFDAEASQDTGKDADDGQHVVRSHQISNEGAAPAIGGGDAQAPSARQPAQTAKGNAGGGSPETPKENSPPERLSLSNGTVAENADGAVVGSLSAEDQDAGDSHSYAVSDDRFEVADGQLKLKDGVALDHEAEAEIEVQVTVTDAAGTSHTEDFTIEVTDQNDAVTGVGLTGSTVAENAEGAVVGSLSAEDQDAGDSHSYAVSDDRFEVADGQLKLKDGVALDHEAEAEIEVQVTVTDAAGTSHTEDFTIEVTDQNDAVTGVGLTGSTVAENAEGAVVGSLSAEDQDAGDSHSYAVSDDRFEVADGQLKLKDGVALDHEAEAEIEVQVTVTDAAGTSHTEDFTIEVTDQNDAVTGVGLTGSTVAENAEGAVVGSLSAEDQDAGDSHSYAVSDDRFEVADGQLKLKDGVALDHEAEAEIEVQVTVTDAAGTSHTEDFTIEVTDQNDAVTGVGLTGSTVAENAEGAVVGSLSAEDQDAGDSHSYAVSDDRFEVADGQLKLKDGVALDHEAEAEIEVQVTVTDAAGTSHTEDFTIEVTDQNDAVTGVGLTGSTVAENAEGAVVGSLSAEDQDAGDSHSYAVSDDRFEVADGQLKLKDGVALDHEAEAEIEVQVTVTDAAGTSHTEDFTIEVTDQNDAVTGVGLTGSTVAENAEGAVVGSLSAEDQDAGDSHSYAVSDDRFEVADGQLKLKDGVALDHEAEAEIEVQVTVTDAAGTSHTEDFTIEVTDQNDAVTGVGLTGSTVAENAEGAVVGSLSAEDQDAGDSHSYAVSDDRFEVADGQLKLKDGVALDHEAEAEIEVQVTVTDAAGTSHTEDFTIEVTDQNDAVTGVGLTGSTVAENAEGAVVGSLSAEDQDAGDSHSYAVSDDRFEVADGQLKLKDGVALDHEAEAEIEVQVTVTDAAGTSHTEDFTIEVTDQNDAVTGVGLTGSTVAENAEGAVVGSLSAEDQDAGDSHSYAVSDDRFEVADGQLKLKDGVALDHEAEAEIEVQVTVTDAAGTSHTEDFTIEVTDQNDAVTGVGLTGSTVAENAEGAVVGSLSAEDQDAGDSHSYAVSDDRFEVADGQLKLKDGVALDHEAEAEIEVQVTVTDAAGTSHTEDFTIEVTDQNDAVTGVGLTGSTVAENAEGAVVGSLSAEDQDAGDSHSYAVSDDRFEVADGQLKLKDGVALDHEAEAEIEVQVTVTDAAGTSHTEDFTIEVTDQNDAVTGVGLTGSTVAENAEGAVVGSLSAEDQDAGDSHSYAVSDDRFEVADGQLKLKDGVALDHEAEAEIEVQVTVTDAAGTSHTEDFTIEVTDQNDAVTGVGLTGSTVAENAEGAVVGSLSAEDQDAGDSHSYAVSDDRFEVADGQLKLKDGVALDHEAEAEIEVQVTVTDAAGTSHTEDFTIEVTDQNDAVTGVGLTGSTVAENAEGAVVGSLSAEDQDAGDSHSYAVSDDRFEVADGQLKLKDGVALDHEAEAEIEVQVTVTDAAGTSHTEDFTIEVTDQNDAVTGVGLTGSTVAENAEGAVVGSLSAEDQDAGDSHSYAVSDDRFEVADGQLKLKDGVALDHEAEAEIEVQVTVTDAAGTSHTEDFTIEVTDQNDAVTGVGLTGSTVAENAEGAVVGSLSAEDQDAGDSHSYAVSDDRFEVADGQLKLKDGVALDHEAEAEIEVQVTVTDAAGTSHTEDFTIEVTDQNDAVTGVGLTGSTVAENAEGAVVGSLSAEDQDAGDSHSYAVSDDRFEVADGQLKLKDGVALDHEAEAEIEVQVTVTDAAGTSHTEDFTIEVTDQNDAVTGVGLTGSTVAENAEGAVVGSLSAEDQDAGDSHSYAVSDDRFEVADGQLKLKDGVALDHEAEAEIEVQVTVTDAAGTSHTEDFTIEVTDQNDAVTGVGLTGSTVAENAEGAVVGSLSAEDQDAGDSHSYAVSDDRFEVADGQLKLKDGVALDHEAEAEIEVQVTVTDAAGTSHTEDFTIEVTDQNDAVTGVGLTGSTVAENAEGAVVGSLSAEDQDAGDSHSYAVSDDRFEVADGQLKLKDGVALDHEAEAEIEVQVTVTDAAGTSHTEDFTIEVTDQNDAVTGVGLTGSTVAENAEGAVVGSLSAEDQDAGDSHSYAVSDDRFEVADGQLKLKDGVALDHEAEAEIEVQVTVTDAAGTSHTEDFTIEVTDQNDAVTGVGLTGSTVAENADGAVVGSLSAEDQDAGDSHSYAVSDDRFEVADGQLKLKDGVALDHEAEAEIEVQVTVTDAAGTSHTEDFTIEVTDQNDAVTGVGLTGSTVAENAEGAVVGSLSAEDQDAGDSHSYAVSDDRFEVADGQLKLKDGVALDHEAEAEIEVQVTVTDAAGTSHTEDFTIEVTDQNDAVTGVGLTGSTVAENAEGAVVGSLSAEDQDAGDSHSYTVSDDRFEVADGQLKLKDGVALDHEAEAEIEVQVTVTDAAGTSHTEDFTIEVTDQNDAVTGVGLTGSTVAENAEGAVVGSLSAEDQDAGDSHSYAVSDDRFEVADGQLKLKDGVALDHEAEAEIEVQVTVTDAAGTSHTEDFAIEISDQNEAPGGLSLGGESENLVQNGSFENFSLETGRWRAFKEDDSGGWDTDTSMEVWDNLGRTDASEGEQHLEMDSGRGVDSISQTIQTNEGQVYDLGVDLRERLTNGTDTVEVYWNDNLVGELDPDSKEWTTFEMQVIGTGEDRLELREAADQNDSYGALVDNITVTSAQNVVAENVRGAIVNRVNFEDPDGDDSHMFEVSDDRFEVANGFLRLKETEALDFEEASEIDISVTVTDSGGLSASETFTVGVADTADLTVSTGFHARYFDVDQRLSSLEDIDWDAEPTHQELVTEIDYENSRESFWEGGSEDTFGVEISGAVQVDEGGTYRFDLGGDDGAQIMVNGQPVVENDGLHAYQTKSGEVQLDPGTHHIEVRYFENYGRAGLKLEWEGPGMDGPELVTAPDMSEAQTVSGMPIAMNVAHPEIELSDTTNLALEGLPAGTVVEAGGKTLVVEDNGSADITGFDTEMLTITPPYDYAGQVDATLTMTDSSAAAGSTGITQPITINVNEAQITEPTAELVTGFRADYLDVDHRIGKLDDVNWDADPTYQDHQTEIDYQNSRESFWEDGSKDTFATRIQGQVTVEEGGSYTFFTSADDGVVVYANGQEVVKDDGNHSYREDSGRIELEPGTHDIEVRYFENYGRAGLKLEWEGPDSDGRETVQADQDIAVDVNGTLDVGIGLEDASDSATVGIKGLPRDTILTSGDNALVTDGGPVDLSGWNINALEVSPPPGYEGEINGEIVVSDTAFNSAPVTSSSDFTIPVGDATAAPEPVSQDEEVIAASGDGSAGDAAWDALPELEDAGGEASDTPQEDILAEPVVVQDVSEITQIGTETYERMDW